MTKLEPISFNKMLLFPFTYQKQCFYTDIDPITLARTQLHNEPEQKWASKIENQIVDLLFEYNVLLNKPMTYLEAKENIIEKLLPEYLKDDYFGQYLINHCHIKYPIDILTQLVHHEYLMDHPNTTNEVYLRELNGTDVELDTYTSNIETDTDMYLALNKYEENELEIF